jgi:acetyl-CoA carboxylase biotin carboxylase subunit
MEMNTRIQAEHPITEQVIDYDLIVSKSAAGVAISVEVTPLYAIECRINAEDPYNDFRPSRKNHYVAHARRTRCTFRYACIPGILFHHYDSMIAKLIKAQSQKKRQF